MTKESVTRKERPEQGGSGSYLNDLLGALHERPVGPGVYTADVYHNSWCWLLQGKGSCSCAPDVKIKNIGGAQ